MGKQKSPPKNLIVGKGKVTPVQIAFIVHRYLAENNFPSTLSAFQSEAAELFGKTKSKEAPKGLLSLGDILDEYVTLKEQKIIVEQEKQRVEGVMRGINAAMESYHSATGGILSPTTPPQPSPIPTPQPPPTPCITAGTSPPAPVVQPPPYIPPNIKQPRPLPNSTSVPQIIGKRKISQTSVLVSAPPKKHCGESRSVSVTRLPQKSEAVSDSKCSQAEKINSLVRVSRTLLSNSNTSPRLSTPSKCSVISSKTIVVSPFKGQGYIAVGKSVCISSPMKSSPQKTCRRDRVKGRLDFEETGALASSSDSTAVDVCGDSSTAEMKDILELDIPDFDLDFNFADLLVNIDLDSEVLLTDSPANCV